MGSPASSASSASECGEETFVAKRILDHRKQKKKLFTPCQDPDGSRAASKECWPASIFQFKVKWEDSGNDKWSEDQHDSWEPFDMFGVACEALIDYFFQHPSLLKDPNLKARFKKAYKRERKARENAGVHVKTTPSLKKPVGDRAYVPPRVQESSESEEEVSLVRDSRQDGPPASSFRQLDKETVSGTGNKKKRPKPKPKTSSQTANTNQPQPSTSKHPPAQSPKKKVIVPDSADESSEASFQRLPATGPSKKNGKAPHRPFKQPSRPSQSDKGKSRQLDSVPLSAPAPQPEPTISREMSPVNGFDRIGGADFSFQDVWMPSSGIPSPPQTEAAQPSIKLPNFSRNVVVPDSEEEEDLDMLNLAPPAHKSQPQPPQPAASSPPMEMEGSMHSDRALSPDLDFYSALDQHEPQATARQPPRSASPLIRPAISPRKRSNLFRHSPDEDEHSTEHTLKDPRPAKRGKPNDDPPSAPAPTQSPPARAPSPPDLFSRAPSPRESIRSPGSPDRQLSPVATPHQESEEEYDALFDEPRRYTNKFFSGSNTNVFGGERPTSKWELSQRTADFKFMEEQVAGYHHMQVVMPPGWRKGQSVETHEHVDAYWSIDANYGPAKHLNGKSRVEELIAGRTAVIFAPKWVEQSKQNTTTTQDVTALQLLLLRRGASDVCGLSKLRQASMIFIHVSELQTVSDLETLVDNKVFNEMRRTRPDVEFAIFGTRSSKQRSASRLSPVFKRIWHIGSAVTFTSKSIMDRASTFGNLVSTGASWSPILKFWLHGNCRILGDRQFQKDHSDTVAAIRLAVANRMNPEVSVINPLLYPDPAEVLKDSTLRTPLWGQGPTFCTNFQSASDAMRNLGLAVLDAEEPDVLVDMSKRLMMIYLETRHWYVVPNAFQLMRLRNGGKESVTNPVEICGLDKLPPFADIYPKVPDSPPVKTQDSSDPTGKLGNVNAMLGDDSLPEPVDISASWNSDSKQWGDSGNTWGDSGDTWGDSGNTWADSGNTWGDKSDAGEGSWGSGHASTGADWSTGSTTVAASGWGGGSETVSADWGDGPANVVSDWGSSTVSKDKTTSSNLNASDWGISTNTQANASGARATSTQNTRRDSSSGIATTGGWGTSDGETETWGSSAPIGSGDGNRVGAVDSWGSPPPRNHTVGVGPQSSAGRVNTASNPEVSSKWGHSRPNSMKSRPAASSHTFSTTHQSKKSRPSTQEGSGWGDDGMTATWNVDSAGGSWGSSW